ncbi:hypothetical protein ABZ734_32235 [Streptomyces sp. NPDC006660]|uniref:hypothetical protein n=1 Tax=Streptomyces sp. NPDC006660 TaxID=3156901 RepID=UPI0033F7712F
MNRSTEALVGAARRRTENAEKAVRKALRQARKDGTPITVKGLVAAAGISTDFIQTPRCPQPGGGPEEGAQGRDPSGDQQWPGMSTQPPARWSGDSARNWPTAAVGIVRR